MKENDKEVNNDGISDEMMDEVAGGQLTPRRPGGSGGSGGSAGNCPKCGSASKKRIYDNKTNKTIVTCEKCGHFFMSGNKRDSL